jgi:hypothetical protein
VTSRELGTGQTRTGCVAYSIPSGKRFSPDGGTTGRTFSWVVR